MWLRDEHDRWTSLTDVSGVMHVKDGTDGRNRGIPTASRGVSLISFSCISFSPSSWVSNFPFFSHQPCIIWTEGVSRDFQISQNLRFISSSRRNMFSSLNFSARCITESIFIRPTKKLIEIVDKKTINICWSKDPQKCYWRLQAKWKEEVRDEKGSVIEIHLYLMRTQLEGAIRLRVKTSNLEPENPSWSCQPSAEARMCSRRIEPPSNTIARTHPWIWQLSHRVLQKNLEMNHTSITDLFPRSFCR